MLKLEGDIRIPAGCAIAAVLNRSGQRFDGSTIIASIATMHKRSNGLGADLPPMGSIPNTGTIMPCIFFTTMPVRSRCVRDI